MLPTSSTAEVVEPGRLRRCEDRVLEQGRNNPHHEVEHRSWLGFLRHFCSNGVGESLLDLRFGLELQFMELSLDSEVLGLFLGSL